MEPEQRLPSYVPEQVALFQTNHLRRHDTLAFDPAQAALSMAAWSGVIAVDIGGDKIRTARSTFQGGSITHRDLRTLQANGGAGYLAVLQAQAAIAAETGFRIGVSSATKMVGSRIERTTNLPVFFDDMARAVGGDYARILPGKVDVVNDTIAGIIGSGTRLALEGLAVTDIAFVICGSGLGAAVIKNGRAVHVEAGHVPLVAALNPLGQATLCNLDGNDFVCLERVTAARAGIEDLYTRLTGDSATGMDLAGRWLQGERLPSVLYETSALALAHAVVGIAERYAFRQDGTGVVVLHGGNFEIARYRDAVLRNLAAMPNSKVRIVFSRDLGDNVCLDGAAVLAGQATISGA